MERFYWGGRGGGGLDIWRNGIGDGVEARRKPQRDYKNYLMVHEEFIYDYSTVRATAVNMMAGVRARAVNIQPLPSPDPRVVSPGNPHHSMHIIVTSTQHSQRSE